MSLLADILGLSGSLIIAFPAYRYSNLLKLINNINFVAQGNSNKASKNDPGEDLVEILNTHKSTWNKLDHYLIMLGIALLAISFIIKILCQLTN